MTTYQPISDYYVQQFHAKVLTLGSIGRVQTFREVLVAIYYELLKEGKIIAIESLSDEDKKELWAEAGNTQLDKQGKVRFCQAIWALNNIL